MGLAAFNRMRRLQAEKELKENEKEANESLELWTIEELEKVKNDDIKERLVELEIEFDEKAIKKDLIALLKGEDTEKNEDE